MTDDSRALDNFLGPAHAFFDDSHPRTWQLGTFASYCYSLPGFPTDRKERKQLAFDLFQDGLRKMMASDAATDKKKETAEKLLNVGFAWFIPLTRPWVIRLQFLID